MCQDIQKVTYTCFHQVSYFYGKSRFCLFTGEGEGRFHTTHVFYTQEKEIKDEDGNVVDENKCPRCKIVEKIKATGGVKKGVKLRQAIETEYAKTRDSREEAGAKHYQAEARKAESQLTLEKIAELKLQIKERIVFYLSKENVSVGAKIVLLRTILSLPDVFNRPEMVKFFASRYFPEGDKERKFTNSERKQIFGMVHRARLDRTFKEGLNMGKPMPLPTCRNAEKVGEASVPKSDQDEIEEGVANMSLSPEGEAKQAS
ncbi:hypothetical protein F5Y10DRAFT_283802 [Nemania abortiva]|nr:hypothetical protein F5Y10DRAFT_283802 [Nemania abortiva]